MAQSLSVLTQNMKPEEAALRNLQFHFRKEAASSRTDDQHQSVAVLA